MIKLFANLIVMEILLFILRLKVDDTFIFLLYLQLWDEKIVFFIQIKNVEKGLLKFSKLPNKVLILI